MPESVSKLAAFVFEHGSMADEILFRNIGEQGEIPGLSPDEREAMTRALPLLRATWIGILVACRESLWTISQTHAAAEVLRTRKTQENKIWEKREVSMPLVSSGRASCGVAFQTWGAAEFRLHTWVWTQARHRLRAEVAVSDLEPTPLRSTNGGFYLTLERPIVGETYDAIGLRAASALWTMARPIAEALSAPELGVADG